MGSLKLKLFLTILMFFYGFCSTELEKSVPNQPTTNEILQAVLKECCKENLKYKIVAICCAADVLKATKEDRFQEFSDIVIPLIKKVMAISITLGFPLSWSCVFIRTSLAVKYQKIPKILRPQIRYKFVLLDNWKPLKSSTILFLICYPHDLWFIWISGRWQKR